MYKGYDLEEMHPLVREKLEALVMIPSRKSFHEFYKDIDVKTSKAYQFRFVLQRFWNIMQISTAREYLDN